MFVFNDACECVSEIWNCAAFLFFFSFGSVCMCVLFFSWCAKLKCRDGGDKKATERRRDSLVFYSRFFFFFFWRRRYEACEGWLRQEKRRAYEQQLNIIIICSSFTLR